MQPTIDSSPESRGTRDVVPKSKDLFQWVRAGFFSATGVALLALLLLFGWKLGHAVLNVVTPFVVAIVLALLLDPLVAKLESRGMNRMFGVSVIFAGFLIILVALGMFLVPPLMNQATQLSENGPTYIERGQTYINDFLEKNQKFGKFGLPKNFQALSDQFSERFSQIVRGSTGRMAGFLLGSVHFLVEAFVVLIVTFYLLLDIKRLKARMMFFAPVTWREPMVKYASDVGAVFSSYLRGLVIVCALYGINTTIVFYGMGFVHAEMRRYALLLGFAAGVLFAVPYVGTISTALIAGVVAFVAGGPAFGAAGVGIIVILNQVYDNIVTPRVIGGGVRLHPVITVLALVLGGELFGLTGLLLSVPVAASIQVILFSVFPKLGTPTPNEFLEEAGVKPELEPEVGNGSE